MGNNRKIKYCRDCRHFKKCNAEHPEMITEIREANGCVNFKPKDRSKK